MKTISKIYRCLSFQPNHILFFFFFSNLFLQSTSLFPLSKKKEERVGGHYWRKVLHTGTGKNPVLPMGRRKKSLVDHRKLVIKRKQASTVGPHTHYIYACTEGNTWSDSQQGSTTKYHTTKHHTTPRTETIRKDCQRIRGMGSLVDLYLCILQTLPCL